MRSVQNYYNRPETYASFSNGSRSNETALPQLGWDYPAEFQHLVHPHWRGFAAPSIKYSALFFIYYVLLIILSVFGNGLVLWIFSTSKNLRTPSNLLIINLAVFDLFMGTNLPHFLTNTVLGYIAGGELGCDIYAVCGSISGLGAAITNAFIAYDRYRTISNPIDGRLSYMQIYLLIAFTWLWCVPFSILPFLRIWGRFIPEGFLTTCSFDYLTQNDETRYFVRTMFAWAYCLPMCVICTYYGKLFLHVRDHERMLAEQAKKMNVKSLSANAKTSAMSVEMRIVKVALTIYMLYVLAWTPYASISIMGTMGYGEFITPLWSMMPASTAKLVSCLDPWVYAASHPKYRLELERRLPWLGVREKNGASTAGGGSMQDAESNTFTVE